MGGDLADPANLVPSHGASCPCPAPGCGRRCNQERGTRPTLPERRGKPTAVYTRQW